MLYIYFHAQNVIEANPYHEKRRNLDRAAGLQIKLDLERKELAAKQDAKIAKQKEDLQKASDKKRKQDEYIEKKKKEERKKSKHKKRDRSSSTSSSSSSSSSESDSERRSSKKKRSRSSSKKSPKRGGDTSKHTSKSSASNSKSDKAKNSVGAKSDSSSKTDTKAQQQENDNRIKLNLNIKKDANKVIKYDAKDKKENDDDVKVVYVEKPAAGPVTAAKAAAWPWRHTGPAPGMKKQLAQKAISMRLQTRNAIKKIAEEKPAAPAPPPEVIVHQRPSRFAVAAAKKDDTSITISDGKGQFKALPVVTDQPPIPPSKRETASNIVLPPPATVTKRIDAATRKDMELLGMDIDDSTISSSDSKLKPPPMVTARKPLSGNQGNMSSISGENQMHDIFFGADVDKKEEEKSGDANTTGKRKL